MKMNTNPVQGGMTLVRSSPGISSSRSVVSVVQGAVTRNLRERRDSTPGKDGSHDRPRIVVVTFDIRNPGIT